MLASRFAYLWDIAKPPSAWTDLSNPNASNYGGAKDQTQRECPVVEGIRLAILDDLPLLWSHGLHVKLGRLGSSLGVHRIGWRGPHTTGHDGDPVRDEFPKLQCLET